MKRPTVPFPRGGALRRTSLALSAVMVATFLQITTPPAEAVGSKLPGLPASEKPVSVTASVKAVPRTLQKGPRAPATTPHRKWPDAAVATVDVPNGSKTAKPGFIRVADTPLTLAPVTKTAARAPHASKDSGPVRVTARVLDRAMTKRAGQQGMLFTLQAKSPARPGGVSKTPLAKNGEVAVNVDYSAFAGAFGGSYASRMRLFELPACVLDTANDVCRTQTAVATTNDTAKQTLSADVVQLRTGSPTVLMAAAATEGDKGDYKATALSPSAAWSTNLNTGDFSWSYDMPVPQVPGGLTPDVGLSYSSGTVDGRTGGTNNQASWAGDGFDLWPGSIERRYKPCAEDGEKNADGNKPGDQCWAYDNAFLSFDGKGGELVPAGNDEFKLQQDNGTKIKRLTSADRGNGDNDGEYWRLTTPDGTRYYFGYNRLPGWSDGKETTDSTWTAPVYGNNAGEPCHASDFAGSWCQQAWRWNLDYAVDTHGNSIAYHYGKESNSYGRNLKAEDDTSYTRGGYLKRIDYGLTSSKMYSEKPQAQVVFDNAERCLPQSGVTCDASTIKDKAFYWYDTPWDLNCAAGTKCDKGRLSPSFWTRKRLTAVTTQVLKPDNTYGKVDSWKLAHRWGMADTDYQLLLDSVQHTGESNTPAITLPKTTFAYTQLENRLDKTGDGYAPFIKARLSTVADESGGQVDANYSTAACDWSALPTPQTNTSRCFPQYIGGDGSDAADKAWFNKYVVTSTTATDRTGGSPDQVTKYQYLDGAAWHYDDDDGLTKEKEKTWSQWRGYGHVRVQAGGEGAGAALKSQQDSYYLRGMDDDRKDTSGGTKTVTVPLGSGEGDPLTDHASTAGFAYKTVTFDKPDGKVLSKTVNRPWHHETAKKVRDWGTVTANLTGTSTTKNWDSLDNGAGTKWRTTSSATTQDTVAGRVTQMDDYGDGTTAADNTCTRTTYATNTDANILDSTARIETVAKPCAAATDRSKDVISDVRTAYDNGAYGAAPTKGDTTGTATLKSYAGTKATYLETGATFDSYGRALTSTDLTADITVDGTQAPVRVKRSDGVTTTTAYTPTTGLPTQIKTTTPPAKAGDATTTQSSSQTLDPQRGLPLKLTDANGNITETTYDALGRSSKVWLANRRNTSTPDYEFTYTTTDGQPTAVTTKTLDNNGGQLTAHSLYDGLLRNRQEQAPGPDGGTILTDTFYDERGQATKTFAPYYATVKPSTKLVEPNDSLAVETQTRTDFDGMGRPTETRQIAGNGDGGTVLNTTKTIYGGDRTTVIPPVGATATTTVTDARGRTTQLLQHHERNADAPFDTISYEYTPGGDLAKATDPAGNSWSYAYDQLGRQTKSVDPDKGTTTSKYDDHGQLVSSTDARGTTLVNIYDNLGRKTETHDGTAGGTLRAKWVYDTVAGAKGQLAETTRYADGQAYTSKVMAYDRLYRPTQAATVVPASEGKLQGTYQTKTTYKPSGLTAAIAYSGVGSLPGGTVTYGYEDQTLRPNAVFGQGMSSGTNYSLTGKPLQYTMNLTGGKKNQVTNTYEWGTQRLATSRVDREEQNGVDRSTAYHYDEAGNVLGMADTSRSGIDNQCFTYDYLGRLNEAWTQNTTSCTTTPPTGKISGPAPYWQSYSYDKSGNRTTETQHNPAGDTSKDSKSTYTYPKPSQPQAHSLTSRTTTVSSDTTTSDYTYDQVGNTTSRPGQKLTWDAEGHLSKVTEGSKTTEYLYDTAGNRLISRTATGTTLYLGTTEITLPKGADKPRATRYIDLGGGQNAVQKDDGTFSFTIADHQGTGQLAINAGNQALTQRRTLPFGGPRGETAKDWPGSKGFVGGTDDTQDTGLTHLGAREYDPTTGRFISVDPVLDLTDSQQMNGYTYSNNNPSTHSDPTGLCPPDLCGNGYPIGGTGTGKNNPLRIVTTAPKNFSRFSQSLGQPKSTGATGRGQIRRSSIRTLIGLEPRTEDRSQLSNYLTSYLGTDGNSFWNTPVGDGDRTAQACFGRAGCRAAYQHLANGGSIEETKKIAATYCITHRAQCIKEASSYDAAQEILAKLPEELAGLYGIKSKGTKATGCKCFLAGTKVLMGDGSTKKIEDLRPGDQVTATNPKTGKTALRKVTRLIVTDDDKKFNKLSLMTSTGVSTLVATHEHPFWSPSVHRWMKATNLKPGATLLTASGKTVAVASNHPFTKQARTYNLTVAGLHTYYVLAGKTPVLVHNSGGCNVADGPRLQARLAADELAGADGHSFQKHVVEQGEFPGIRTRAQFSDMIEGVILNGERRVRSDGASAYWRNGVIVIRNPGSRDGGTVFAPQEGHRYFTRNFKSE
ncbi:sugar-binding protein [Streptomyces tsukubensis]|nr:sugar-binding protein [Streptomyces tsukubensis]